jgi:hypothetical protein
MNSLLDILIPQQLSPPMRDKNEAGRVQPITSRSDGGIPFREVSYIIN